MLKDIVIEQPIPKTDETACVDTRGDAITNPTPVDAFHCTLGVNERWTYTGDTLFPSGGQLQGVSTKAVKTCLALGTGTGVQLQTCGGTAPQDQVR